MELESLHPCGTQKLAHSWISVTLVDELAVDSPRVIAFVSFFIL